MQFFTFSQIKTSQKTSSRNMSKVPLVEQSWGYTYLLFSWPSSTELTHGPSSRLTANGCKPFTCSVSATFLVFGDQTSWQTHQSPKRQVCQTYMYVQSSVSGGWLSSSTSDACQKVHQCTMFFKHLLNCSSASSAHQSLIGGESQEDHEAAGCVVFLDLEPTARNGTSESKRDFSRERATIYRRVEASEI